MSVSLREIVALHAIASGPVSVESILNYCDVQAPGFVSPRDDSDVIAEINHLLRAGIIELYDDGKSFSAGPVRWNVLNEPEPENELLDAARKVVRELHAEGLRKWKGPRVALGEAVLKAEGGAR